MFKESLCMACVSKYVQRTLLGVVVSENDWHLKVVGMLLYFISFYSFDFLILTENIIPFEIKI